MGLSYEATGVAPDHQLCPKDSPLHILAPRMLWGSLNVTAVLDPCRLQVQQVSGLQELLSRTGRRVRALLPILHSPF